MTEQRVSPKACAEELGYTFLPCVLAYLHRAPLLKPLPAETDTSLKTGYSVGGARFLSAGDVNSVIVPVSAPPHTALPTRI